MSLNISKIQQDQKLAEVTLEKERRFKVKININAYLGGHVSLKLLENVDVHHIVWPELIGDSSNIHFLFPNFSKELISRTKLVPVLRTTSGMMNDLYHSILYRPIDEYYFCRDAEWLNLNFSYIWKEINSTNYELIVHLSQDSYPRLPIKVNLYLIFQ